MIARPWLKTEVAIAHCRICRCDREQPGMTISPVSVLPTSETVHVCGKCLLDMLKVLLKGPASHSKRSGSA
jgi:hypothetical protein